jgi:hypothetical protein
MIIPMSFVVLAGFLGFCYFVAASGVCPNSSIRSRRMRKRPVGRW